MSLERSSSAPMRRHKSKTLSEIVNDQFTQEQENRYGASLRHVGDEDDLAPVVDDFDEFGSGSPSPLLSRAKAPRGSPGADNLLSESAAGSYSVLPAKQKKAKIGVKTPADEANLSHRSGTLDRLKAAKGKRIREDKDGDDEGGKLRRRGPLDAALSSGRYAGRRIDVDAVMDDIFGALDDDGTGDVDMDDPAARTSAGGPSSRAMASEEAYVQWYEENRQKRGKLGRSSTGIGDEDDILNQIEELRQAQLKAVGSAAHGDDESDDAEGSEAKDQRARRTAEAIQHYVLMYAQLLRVRVGFQPMVGKAIALPQYYALPVYCNPEPLLGQEQSTVAAASATLSKEKHGTDVRGELLFGGSIDVQEILDGAKGIRGALEGITEGLRSVLGNLLDLTELAAGKKSVASSKARSTKGVASTSTDSIYTRIERYHSAIMKECSACIEYWGKRTVQAHSVKLNVVAQPLLQQIQAVLAVRPRLLRKVQRNRFSHFILGHPHHELASEHLHAVRKRQRLENDGAVKGGSFTDADLDAAFTEAKAKRTLSIAEGDVDEEIYDDGEFVRELVKRSGRNAAGGVQAHLEEVDRIMKSGNEPSKRGFHRKTKGKAVNYEPRPKLVGFMVPTPYNLTLQHEAMMSSLFK